MFVKTEPYLELSRTSMMELFAKIVNSFQLFSQKARLGSNYASEKTEIFNVITSHGNKKALSPFYDEKYF